MADGLSIPAAAAEEPKDTGFISQEQIDAEVAAINGEQPPAKEEPAEGDKPSKPDWVPEKFWDAEKGEVRTEELAKSYQELESNRSKPPADEKPAEGEADPDAAAKDVLKANGFEFQALATEFEENGNFKPETLAKLETTFGKELVADYVQAKQAQFAAAAGDFNTQVMAAAGGAEGYKAATAWAAQNLTPQEIAEFDAHVTSGDATRAKLAATALAARFEASGGKAPSLVNGGNSPTGNGGYGSMDEMSRDVDNPLYKTDPAFRDKVDAKINRSMHLLGR